MLIERLPEDIKEALRNAEQPIDRHPEKTVYNHIWLVEKEAEKFNEPILLICAVLHDIGKKDVIQVRKDKNVFYGHELASLKYIPKLKHLFLDVLPADEDWEVVKWVCQNHMKAHILSDMRPFKKEEITSHKWFPMLMKFAYCDDHGRGEMPDEAK